MWHENSVVNGVWPENGFAPRRPTIQNSSETLTLYSSSVEYRIAWRCESVSVWVWDVRRGIAMQRELVN